MSYFKIAACAAILMSGMASVNSALAGNKGGVSASAPGQQMRLNTPPPNPGAGGASTFAPGQQMRLNTPPPSPGTGGASTFAPGAK